MDPIAKFISWMEEAEAHPGIKHPTAMSLATADVRGRPSIRMVLLKGVDKNGFVFYTNTQSQKGKQLKANPQAALCFYWMPLDKQVRIEGRANPVSVAEADAYFASRPRESCIGAWASKQSEPLESREALEQAVLDYSEKFKGGDVPRPPHWSGWRVIPERIEFWSEGAARLHDRELFSRLGDGWSVKKLYP